MWSRIFISASLWLAACNAAWGQAGVNSVTGNAGIVAYACVEQTAHYILGLDSVPNRGWSHLGGGNKPRNCTRPDDCEPQMATALREFYEESNCAIRPDSTSFVTVRGPSVLGESPHTFSTYLMEIEYRSVSLIKNSTACPATKERIDWAWISHENFYRYVSNESEKTLRLAGLNDGVKVWGESEKALRKAFRDGLLTERDPCKLVK